MTRISPPARPLTADQIIARLEADRLIDADGLLAYWPAWMTRADEQTLRDERRIEYGQYATGDAAYIILRTA